MVESAEQSALGPVTTLLLFLLLAALALLLLGGSHPANPSDAVRSAAESAVLESAAFEEDAAEHAIRHNPVAILRANVCKNR